VNKLRQCDWCSQEFQPRNSAARFCQKECRLLEKQSLLKTPILIILGPVDLPEFYDPDFLRYEDEYFVLLNQGYNNNEAMIRAYKRTYYN
jgi:hypothetical protein